MLTFKLFLSETDGSNIKNTELNADQAISFIEENCTKYIDGLNAGNRKIWRGFLKSSGAGGDIMFGDSRGFVRKSANTSNWYNMFIDNSPKWKAYPPRLSSYICTTSPGYADSYGKVYLVLPADDAQLGLTPATDMWFSFDYSLYQFGHIEDISHFQDVIHFIWNNSKKGNQKLSSTDWQVLKNQLKDFSIQEAKELVEGTTGFGAEGSARHLVRGMERRNCKNLYDLFDFILDPVVNKFSHGGPDLNTSQERSREIWIHGKCLFLKRAVEPSEGDAEFEKVATFLKEKKNISTW
jgi:hypothetical protein